MGRDAARRLRLPEEVQRGVYHVYEGWRGGGDPAGLSGDDLPVGSRVARLTGIAVLFDTIGGVGMAVDAARRRGGAAATCSTRGWSGGSWTAPRRSWARSTPPTHEPWRWRRSPGRW